MPSTGIILRDTTSRRILEAYGIHAANLEGDGNALIQARRQLFLDTIQPLSALIEQELSLKLGTRVQIHLTQSQYRDHAHNARALKGYIDAGLSLPNALAIMGISVPTSPRQARADDGVWAEDDDDDDNWFGVKDGKVRTKEQMEADKAAKAKAKAEAEAEASSRSAEEAYRAQQGMTADELYRHRW